MNFLTAGPPPTVRRSFFGGSGLFLHVIRWSRDFLVSTVFTGSLEMLSALASSAEILSRDTLCFADTVDAKNPAATRRSCSARATAIFAAISVRDRRRVPPVAPMGFGGEKETALRPAGIEESAAARLTRFPLPTLAAWLFPLLRLFFPIQILLHLFCAFPKRRDQQIDR